MLQKEITYIGQPRTLACDGVCGKAWGINSRPTIQLSCDPDDFAYLSDWELGTAPEDPQTYEGGQAKPRHRDERLNRWCARECERSRLIQPGEAIVLPDFSERLCNIPAKE